jgi:hypothetical protein
MPCSPRPKRPGTLSRHGTPSSVPARTTAPPAGCCSGLPSIRGWSRQISGRPTRFVETLRRYSLAGVAEKITCPTFVCNAEGDDISARAPQLVDALVCPKEFVTFTNAEGAGDHYEAGNRAIYHARSFDWLDRVLGSAG